MNRNRIHSRLFKKVFRHRPNRRLQYLRARKTAKARRSRRALRRGEFAQMRKAKPKKTLRGLDREAIRNRDGRPQEPDELASVTKITDWSPKELTRIWRNTSG